MASNSSWLAAYEAQKAAVLQKMTTSKSETDSSAIVSGASEFSGLVDIESVKNFSKSTQVTKLMNTLKKPHPIPVKREVQPVQNPLSSRSTSSSSTASWNVPTNQSASFHPTSSSSSASCNGSANQSFSTHHQSASSKKNNVHAGFGPNWNNGSASKFMATETFETSKAGQSCGPLISDEKLLSHSATANGVQTNAEVSNRKKKRDNGEVPIKDLFKRVKSDSTKNSADWAKVCKLVMSYVLIT
jgi:hypothetical protein